MQITSETDKVQALGANWILHGFAVSQYEAVDV